MRLMLGAETLAIPTSAMELDGAVPHLRLFALAVFRNLLNEELIKSIHLYRLEDGKISAIQREFMFCPSSYKQLGELAHGSVHARGKEDIEQFMANLREGEERGLWICILHHNCNLPPSKSTIPNVLNLARNPALKTLPELAEDLDHVSHFRQMADSMVSSPLAPINIDNGDREIFRECEYVDVQPSILSTDGFWPAIPGLTNVPFVLKDCIEHVCTPGDVIQGSNPVFRIKENLGQAFNEYLPGDSSCNVSEASLFPRDDPRCLEKKIHRTNIRPRVNSEDRLVSQLLGSMDETDPAAGSFSSYDHTHGLDDPSVATLHTKNPSMQCGNESIAGLCNTTCTTGQRRRTLSVEEDENRKKHRAPAKRVADIALKDLAKYFDVPIAEASRRLQVGLTVLKKKCREFGIPRWPHRKIKSLDSLIQNLQEEAKRQEREDQGAAMAAMKRTRLLETEKEKIEKKPSIDIQKDTKRFRQDIFKRRHKARALGKKHESSNSYSDDGDPLEESPSVSTNLSLMIDEARTLPFTD